MKRTIEGFCPICERDIALREPTERARRGQGAELAGLQVLVHHGYQRPGDGFIVGDCFAVGLPPHELSPITAAKYNAFCEVTKLALIGELARLRAGKVVELHRDERVPVPTTEARPLWHSGTVDPGWQQWLVPYRVDETDPARAAVYRDLLARRIARTESEIEHRGREMARMADHVSSWELKPVRERDVPVPDPKRLRRGFRRRF